jgi:hypothetical protein
MNSRNYVGFVFRTALPFEVNEGETDEINGWDETTGVT